MARARSRVEAGVRGASSIRCAGWKAEKCTGTSCPSSDTIQAHSAAISSSESLRPGMSRVVISSQVPSSLTLTRVSSTSFRRPPVTRR